MELRLRLAAVGCGLEALPPRRERFACLVIVKFNEVSQCLAAKYFTE
jgi:hypothetical protein